MKHFFFLLINFLLLEYLGALELKVCIEDEFKAEQTGFKLGQVLSIFIAAWGYGEFFFFAFLRFSDT